jgi:hypothetical protein
MKSVYSAVLTGDLNIADSPFVFKGLIKVWNCCSIIYLIITIGLTPGGNSTAECSTVQYSTVRYVQLGTVCYSASKCGRIQYINYSRILNSAIHYTTLKHSTLL